MACCFVGLTQLCAQHVVPGSPRRQVQQEFGGNGNADLDDPHRENNDDSDILGKAIMFGTDDALEYLAHELDIHVRW